MTKIVPRTAWTDKDLRVIRRRFTDQLSELGDEVENVAEALLAQWKKYGEFPSQSFDNLSHKERVRVLETTILDVLVGKLNGAFWRGPIFGVSVEHDLYEFIVREDKQ